MKIPKKYKEVAVGRPKTSRETEIAGLVCRGMSNKEIGVALGITERTVKDHLTHVYKKLGFYGASSRFRLICQQLGKCESRP